MAWNRSNPLLKTEKWPKTPACRFGMRDQKFNQWMTEVNYRNRENGNTDPEKHPAPSLSPENHEQLES